MDRTIYTICETLKFDKQTTRTSIYLMQKKYCLNVEDLKDLIMDTYIKYTGWKIDPTKNKQNLFTWILENKIRDFFKKHNRMLLYNDFDSDEQAFEETIIDNYDFNEKDNKTVRKDPQ